MMNGLILAALLQSIVSAEAGLVNHVEGPVNVPANLNVAEGSPIRTGADGYVEVLLNPGSFLRLGPDSEAVIEDTSLAAIRVRVVSGVAVLEASEILEEFPVTVVTGNLRTSIFENGIYRFEDGRASVLAGRLDVPASDLSQGLAYEKGWSVHLDRVYRATPTAPEQIATDLDRWSASRAAMMAEANSRAYQSLRGGSGFVGFGGFGGSPILAQSWIWVPNLGAWTFFPAGRYQSPYGFRYYSISDLIRFRAGERRAALSSGVDAGNGGGGRTSGGGGSSPGDEPSPGGTPAPPAPTYRDVVPERNGPATRQQN
jgi:hypothetical protein